MIQRFDRQMPDVLVPRVDKYNYRLIWQIAMEWDGSILCRFSLFIIIHFSIKSIIHHHIQKVAFHTKGRLAAKKNKTFYLNCLWVIEYPIHYLKKWAYRLCLIWIGRTELQVLFLTQTEIHTTLTRGEVFKKTWLGWEGSAIIIPAHFRALESCRSWSVGKLQPITFSVEQMIHCSFSLVFGSKGSIPDGDGAG